MLSSPLEIYKLWHMLSELYLNYRHGKLQLQLTLDGLTLISKLLTFLSYLLSSLMFNIYNSKGIAIVPTVSIYTSNISSAL